MDTALDTLSINVTPPVPPLLAPPEVGAHIHGFAPPGVPAGPLFLLPPGFPKVAVWSYPPGDEASIIAGLTYVNVHTAGFPGGEIRGQILRVPSCGDTITDGPGETCDDGNNTSGDGCSATCQTEPAPPIPGLSGWGLGALASLLMAAALRWRLSLGVIVR